ncbi:MAG: hypothetical protein NT094_02615 [Candidatus Staskawiczbacteria bacterium]|nr:hypothetical protein [Candidatus Staskawiczbacteria bacterium]
MAKVKLKNNTPLGTRKIVTKKKLVVKKKIVAKNKIKPKKKIIKKRRKKIFIKPKTVLEMSKEKFDYLMARIATI